LQKPFAKNSKPLQNLQKEHHTFAKLELLQIANPFANFVSLYKGQIPLD
jgi:hypothetical protein